jgi:hypothetical protein
MGLIFILIGLNVQILFMFKEDWLYGKKSMFLICSLNMCLFVVGLILQNNETIYPKTLAALKMPFFSALIFYVLHQSFKKMYKRNPENTFLVFSKKPMVDVIFSILFWIIGTGLPVFIFF